MHNVTRESISLRNNPRALTSVHNVSVVHVLDGLEKSARQQLRFVLGVRPLVHQSVEQLAASDVLGYDEQSVVRLEHILQRNDVGVAEFL